MLKVKGIYDGEHIRLLEDVSILPNTEVEVLIPDPDAAQEEAYFHRLIELGLIKEHRQRVPENRSFRPVPISGEPLSQTIIDQRR